ncbi:cAMP-binding domain of CRP or a regulatory subunit of cAMP-dependent protein kinases [Rhodospirillales bacterium URHD0017]|nr:cAMP-binding domain of CRP or a regulatory subunit of cAMP-dependent protein kinases [Rhodospirillales bacterium URHD0017]
MPASDKSKATNRTGKSRIAKLGSTITTQKAGRKSSGRQSFDVEAFVTTVGVGRTISTYNPKSYIFRQGMACDAVFYIQKGQVELSVLSRQGKERVVGVLNSGAFLGEGCLAGQPRYLASARASTEAAVARVEKATLAKALNDHPALSQRFMAFLLLRNGQIEADLVDHLFNSSEKRLARLLVMLAQVGQEAELRPVAAPISQEVMAARVGTTRSRINYFMNKFRKLGLIEYNGDLKVHSSLLNVIIRE